MDISIEIRALGRRFAGRLDPAILADALEYLDFNEWGLALEVLAEKLSDEGSTVTAAECAKFDELGACLGLPKDRFQFLRDLHDLGDVPPEGETK